MTEELKPCPFCGGSAIDCGKDDICCTTPGCAMANKYIPLKEWNTRAEPAPFQYGIRHNAVEDYLYDEKGLRPAPEPDDVETVTLFQCKIVEKNCDHEWMPENGNPEYCAKCGTSLMAYAMMECF